MKRYYNELERGTHKGYDWYVAHNMMGFRVGYVRVPRRHPWWQVPYSELNDEVDVHGGLTYCEKGPAKHVPDFSYQWWIGFDCGHAWDAPDLSLVSPEQMALYEQVMGPNGEQTLGGMMFGDGTVRSQEYVVSECVALCEQAAIAMNRHITTTESISYA